MSPLRFPGGKRRLVPFIRAVLDQNELRPELFVEPFAGGASVALQLLGERRVEQIGLADRDPLIASFWRAVFFESDWLVDQIHSVEVTLDGWEQWRARVDAGNLDERERALACLYLNRTSFSGILSRVAGPIGGKAQESSYPIDCRFPRDTLAKRVRLLTEMSDRVAFIWNHSWPKTLSLLRAMRERETVPEEVFLYLDPPFFEKADRLYTHYFEWGDHRRLRDALIDVSTPWLLSYDDSPKVAQLYRANGKLKRSKIDLLYNQPQNGNNTVAAEAIVSNLSVLPKDVKLWERG